jgi:hypothetical protein
MARLISPLVQHMYQNHMAMPFGDIAGCEEKSVYIPFTASGSNQAFVGKSIFFNSDTDLDYTNSIITGIEIIDAGTSTFASTQPIRQNADTSILVNGVLTLTNPSREIIAELPLIPLVRNFGGATSASSNAKTNKSFWLQNVLWQNCFVTFSSIAGISANIALQFVITYIPLSEIKK